MHVHPCANPYRDAGHRAGCDRHAHSRTARYAGAATLYPTESDSHANTYTNATSKPDAHADGYSDPNPHANTHSPPDPNPHAEAA